MMDAPKKVLLKVRNLKQWFPVNSLIFEKRKFVKAVNDVSFDLYEGETLGIAGESGCGKSTLIRTCLRLLNPTAGSIEYDGREISRARQGELRSIRKEMQIIFQDPYASLDGRWTVRQLLEEPMIVNRLYSSKSERRSKVSELLEAVSISQEYTNRYPHEFSGGQRQRIAIASALATDPKLVVCDEPVSALDVSVRAQVLNLLKDLQEQRKLTYIFVSHDMSVIEYICDRVAIMYLGKIVEIGDKKAIFEDARHPYTQALLSAVPKVTGDNGDKERIILEGDIPSPVDPPSGCVFRTRCRYATARCAEVEPTMTDLGNGHCVSCHLLDKEKAGEVAK
ncbi:MAG: dipeptide ABC transporter ATP-binding protein [Lachnospiraceae bacterium]|nr:dipeptide ABC transporter ATP-binding protein [Lachnospiraceae bacterium]